jgi:hypothetical protein
MIHRGNCNKLFDIVPGLFEDPAIAIVQFEG